MATTMKRKQQQSIVESLIITIPGLSYPVRAIFPPGVLKKCSKCKLKYGKGTRPKCRIIERHTFLPWSEMYLQITIDKSCLKQQEEENIKKHLDQLQSERIHGYRSVLPHDQVYIAKPSLDDDGNEYEYGTDKADLFSRRKRKHTRNFRIAAGKSDKMPLCLVCKSQNRSQSICRTKFKHLDVPHSTVFLTLFVATREERESLQRECEERILQVMSATSEERKMEFDVGSVEPKLNPAACDEKNYNFFCLCKSHDKMQSSTFLATIKSSAGESSYEVRLLVFMLLTESIVAQSMDYKMVVVTPLFMILTQRDVFVFIDASTLVACPERNWCRLIPAHLMTDDDKNLSDTTSLKLLANLCYT